MGRPPPVMGAARMRHRRTPADRSGMAGRPARAPVLTSLRDTTATLSRPLDHAGAPPGAIGVARAALDSRLAVPTANAPRTHRERPSRPEPAPGPDHHSSRRVTTSSARPTPTSRSPKIFTHQFPERSTTAAHLRQSTREPTRPSASEPPGTAHNGSTTLPLGRSKTNTAIRSGSARNSRVLWPPLPISPELRSGMNSGVTPVSNVGLGRVGKCLPIASLMPAGKRPALSLS